MTSSPGTKFLAIFGHINIDYIMGVTSIPTSGSTPVESIREVYGGTAGNFSMVSSSLKLDFDLYSAVSRKSHQSYLDFLKKRGVDISNILVDERDTGPICYAASTGKDQVYFVYQGPMSKPYAKNTARLDRHYKYLHLGTGDPIDMKYAIENMSYDYSVFDPGQELNYRYSRDQVSFFLERCDIAIFNDHEAEFAEKLTHGLKIGKESSTMIVTHGNRGCSLIGRNSSIEIKARQAERVFDTVGAGDAFRAGLYLGLSKGLDLRDSAVVGSIVSSIAIRSPITEFNTDERGIMEIFQREKSILRGF